MWTSSALVAQGDSGEHSWKWARASYCQSGDAAHKGTATILEREGQGSGEPQMVRLLMTFPSKSLTVKGCSFQQTRKEENPPGMEPIPGLMKTIHPSPGHRDVGMPHDYNRTRGKGKVVPMVKVDYSPTKALKIHCCAVREWEF